jgi:hypothetical protein
MGRRSRRLLLGGVVVAAALLLGRGLGWLQSPTGRVHTDLPPAGEPEVPPVAAAVGTDRGPAGVGNADANGSHLIGAVASVPASHFGIDDDRMQSALSGARAALADGRLGGGLLALDALLGSPLSPTQVQTVQAARQQLEQATAAACDALRQQLQAGQVLAARSGLRALQSPAHPAVLAVLRALTTAQHWPDLVPSTCPDGYVPPPAALPRDRLVRTLRAGSELQARVVDATAAEVTLRVVARDGVTFPSFRVVDVEPLQATPAEAAEQGFAALAAGDGALARLWLCCALGQDAAAAGPRAMELQELLRKAP